MKHLPLKISVMAIAIVVIFFGAILLAGSEKIIKDFNIGIGAKQLSSRVVSAPHIITSVPSKDVDKYDFAGKRYKMFCQYSREYEGYNRYLAGHGCAVTTLTTVLATYVPECKDWTPYETITIAEKRVAGETVFNNNYKKSYPKQMPITLLGITNVLNEYGISHKYEPFFSSDSDVKEDIIEHLRKGMPVIFIICTENRKTGQETTKWTLSSHTMLMIGVDEEDNVLIGNPAGKQRFQIVKLDEMINYMWSCSDKPNSFYSNGKKRAGGYIKIME